MTPPRTRVFARARDDDGFALVTVVGTMAVLTLVVLASMTYAVNSVASSRRTQDWHAALAAAQSGVDDLLSRLNTCDGYWSAPCPGGPTHADLTTNWGAPVWLQVPSADAATKARFAYGFVTVPSPVTSMPAATVQPGLIRIRASGEVNGVERTIVADLRKKGFLNYIYYTDKESTDPVTVTELNPSRVVDVASPQTVDDRATPTDPLDDRKIVRVAFDGVTASWAARCGRHYYSVPPAAGARSIYVETVSYSWRDGNGAVGTYPRMRGAYDALLAYDLGDRVTYNGYTYEAGGPVAVGVAPGTTGAPWYGTYEPAGKYYRYGSCDIMFADNDVVSGPLYTKDAILLAGTPLFKGRVETYWQRTYSPAANPSRPWRAASGSYSSDKPDPAGVAPVIAAGPSVDLPPTNGALRTTAAAGGCVYTGPTSITLQAGGTMRVTSPQTTSPSPGCGTGLATEQTVSLPSNGVVYVDAGSGGCTGPVLGTYPRAGEWHPPGDYGCAAGDAYVKGTLAGRLTVAAANNVYVVGNTTYAGGTTGGDVLGLVAQGFVKVYHPVRCDFVPAPGTYCASDAAGSSTRFDNLLPEAEAVTRIHAAILSVDHSFTVQNYDKGEKVTAPLSVFGGIYQRYRGAVGTGGSSSGGTGYLKDYSYDERLASLPPPSFLQPTSAPWDVVGFSED